MRTDDIIYIISPKFSFTHELGPVFCFLLSPSTFSLIFFLLCLSYPLHFSLHFSHIKTNLSYVFFLSFPPSITHTRILNEDLFTTRLQFQIHSLIFSYALYLSLSLHITVPKLSPKCSSALL